MIEGLSSGEMAGEISRHKKHSAGHENNGDESDTGDGTRSHDRTLSIIEAVMLAVVALLAAYTGYASAKWGTESSVRLAAASAARTEANRAALDAQDTRNFDSTTFNTWFTAYVTGDTTAEAVAVRRFRPAFKVAFDAWLATDPFTNALAPPGPTYVPQYKQPELAASTALDTKATEGYTLGVQAGSKFGQLRPRHHLPRHHSVPDRDQRSLPLLSHPGWPGRPGGIDDDRGRYPDCDLAADPVDHRGCLPLNTNDVVEPP